MRSFQETKRGQQVKEKKKKEDNTNINTNTNTSKEQSTVQTTATKGHSTGAKEQQEVEMTEIDRNREKLSKYH